MHTLQAVGMSFDLVLVCTEALLVMQQSFVLGPHKSQLAINHPPMFVMSNAMYAYNSWHLFLMLVFFITT